MTLITQFEEVIFHVNMTLTKWKAKIIDKIDKIFFEMDILYKDKRYDKIIE